VTSPRVAEPHATRPIIRELIDQEAIYAPRESNDRLLLGSKGSLNEYELDVLRQRSLAACYEKARRSELIVAAPVGSIKAGDRLEKDPDRRVRAAIQLAIDKVAELGSVRQALFWFIEHKLDLPTWINSGPIESAPALLHLARVHLYPPLWRRVSFRQNRRRGALQWNRR
jgi:DNA invertase Pin-like site-specific DNA recombinase